MVNDRVNDSGKPYGKPYRPRSWSATIVPLQNLTYPTIFSFVGSHNDGLFSHKVNRVILNQGRYNIRCIYGVDVSVEVLTLASTRITC